MLGNPGKIHSVTGWTHNPLESTIKDLLAYWRTEIKRELTESLT